MNLYAARQKTVLQEGNVSRLGEVPSKKIVAYDVLKRRIVRHELQPGVPINENALSDEMKISKTPIREALQQLEREGFVQTIPGRGSFVTHITVQDVREIFETREIIECAVARRAALVGDKELIKAKRVELESSDLMSDGEKGLELDLDDVHVFIFGVVGNKRLFEIYSQLLDQIIRLRHYFNVRLDTERMAKYNNEHLRILDALIKSDPDQAEQAVLTHLRNASAYLTRRTLF
jgi:GntR family transcriptional regulator, rspAB operon transcriptional repressor